MEHSYGQIIMVIMGATLCLMALAVMFQDGVSRVTEALLDRIEIALATRQKLQRQRQAERADASIHVSVFSHS